MTIFRLKSADTPVDAGKTTSAGVKKIVDILRKSGVDIPTSDAGSLIKAYDFE